MESNISNFKNIKTVYGIIHIGILKNEDKYNYLMNFHNITENNIVCINDTSIYKNELNTINIQNFYEEYNNKINKFNFITLCIEDINTLFFKVFINFLNSLDYIYVKIDKQKNNINDSFLQEIDNILNRLDLKKQNIQNTHNLFYVKKNHNISSNYIIEYGLGKNKINITNFILKNKNDSGICFIPSGDENRALLFGDPLFGKVKNIYISDKTENYIIDVDTYINFDTINNKLFINESEKSYNIGDETRNSLSIMSIFKNEAMNLKIWIEHYLWQGVEHFYLIDNGSTDSSFEILKEYIDKGIVTYYYRPEKHQQPEHYRYVFDKENLKNKTKWLCICDLDEFFFGTEDLLIKTLNQFDNYDVIYTNSHFYGSDNLIEHPKDIRTAIIHREADLANGTKYIFKSMSIVDSSEIWIHWIVEPNTFTRKNMKEIWQTDKIRLNHYRIQSFEYFTKIKMTRGDVSIKENENIRDLQYFKNYTEISNIKDDLLKKIIEKGYNSNNMEQCININTALIVEPHFFKHLPFVINDFNKKLGINWKVVFYCGKGLKNIWIDLLDEDIEIREIINNCDKYNEYCDFLKSRELWASLYGDYVLVFNFNSYIINKEPYTIDFFINQNKSYIGGNQFYLWNELRRENIYPPSCNFQGGLSLRKRLDMIKIIDTFGSDRTYENSQESKSMLTDAEDVYFTIGCYKLNLPVGDNEICSHFSCHTIIKDKFFGANQLEPGYYLNLVQQYDNICDNIYLIKNANDIENEAITIHNTNGGFFSNCTVRLFDIILYFNATKKLPLLVDSSKQFELYKEGTNMNDITEEYFIKTHIDIQFNNKIDFKEQYQYIDYKNLIFNDISTFIHKYFTPAPNIIDTIDFLENKYFITNYHNICVLFYRGNDKLTEINLPDYTPFIEKAKSLYFKNNNIIFLIQSDENEFIQKMKEEFPDNSFYFKDEIRSINKNNNLSVDMIRKETNFIYSKYFLAITIIMSRCKYIICTTGNCSLWIALFRGNANNIYQCN